MYTYAWYHWITFFYLYCFFGWIFESTYVSFKQHHFVNRGFPRLPMLPLYGSGAILLLWVSLPYQDNLILVYIAGFIAATALEYVTGAVMERLFKVRYWDYSDKKFNINGYICLGSSIAWGFLTIFMTEVIHKPIADFVTSLNPVVEFTFIAVVSVLFVYDTVRSTKEALDLARVLESMTKLKTEAEELQIQLALLKAETSEKVSEIKNGAVMRISELKEEAADRAMKAADTAAQRASEMTQSLTDRQQRAEALAEKLRSLAETRHKLSHHMSHYRRRLLNGNPTAYSKKFAEALNELKKYGTFKNGSDQ